MIRSEHDRSARRPGDMFEIRNDDLSRKATRGRLALALHREHGSTDGEAFADDEQSRFNRFLHLPLRSILGACGAAPVQQGRVRA